MSAIYQISEHTKDLVQSGIRSASIRCAEIGGINLGQGICDLPMPAEVKEAINKAMHDNKTIYSACEGLYPLREAIAQKNATFNHMNVDPKTEVLVTHGSTGAYVCLSQVLFNPGDEVILFEPFYGYHKNVLGLQHVNVKAVNIDLSNYAIDFDELKQTITKKTKAIVICTPNNPSGKVFSQEELLKIGTIAEQHNLMIITDEIYEYITYPGYEHISMAALENFKERTLTISGFSKTYNMTGLRLGYVSGPKIIIEKMALVQDLLYVCPATPLQYGALAALQLPQHYYSDMQAMYLQKRDKIVAALRKIGFDVVTPQGAYYLMATFNKLGFTNDKEAVNALLEKAKVATVTGGSFYIEPEKGSHLIRICYSIDDAKVQQALNNIVSAF